EACADIGGGEVDRAHRFQCTAVVREEVVQVHGAAPQAVARALLVDDRDVAGPVAIEVVFEAEAFAPAREADGLPWARVRDGRDLGGGAAAGHQRRGQRQVGAADAVPQRIGVGGDV